jgi:hypothetical protein
MAYYKYMDGVAYDRSLLNRARELTEGMGDGRISENDIREIYQLALDAGRLTDVERRTLHYIRSHFKLTDKAAEWFEEALPFSGDFDEKIEEILRNELDFSTLRWVIEEAEAQRQASLGSQQDFFSALRDAVQAIFSEAESSTSLRDVIYMETGTDFEDIEAMNRLRREWMNTGTLYLVPLDWEQQTTGGTWKHPMPFYEPDLNDYWVFLLEMPTRTKYLFLGEVRRRAFAQAFSSGFLPDNRTLEEWSKHIVEEEFQLPGLQYFFDYEDAARQQALGGRVKKFPDALRQALVNLIQFSDNPVSFLNHVGNLFSKEISMDDFPFPGAYWQALQEKAKAVLNESKIWLIPLNIEEIPEEERGDLQFPEGGESPQENWVFQVVSPHSDEVFWVILNRNGERQGYNYGFN